MSVLTQEKIDKFSKKFNENNLNIITKNAISNNKLSEIVKDRDYLQKRNNVFSKYIEIDVKNTNQKNSGRCWIFAFLNLIRLDMIKKYNLDKDFEFSQNYLFFWDKLEKSNFFINSIIKTKKQKVDSRLLQHLLNEPVSDGGQWNMLVNLVNKYGIIPKTSMNETFSSSHSEELNYLLNNKLRNIAYEIRETKRITKKMVHKYLEDIYQMLVIFLGEPPKKIIWEYYSIKGKKTNYNIVKDLSPIDFYKDYIPFNINEMVCLVNAPCKSKPFYNLFDLKYFGNVLEGKKSNFINIPIKEMINIAKKSLDNNKALWFGSDVDKYSDYETGIMDPKYYNYQSVFNDMKEINKGSRLDYCVSRITHAMVIKGYDMIDGKITKWLIENSWGEWNELEGNLIMSNNWFEEYVLEIVVHKKFVSEKIKKILDKKPIELEPWDPLGLLLKPLKKTIKKKSKKYKLKTKKNIIFY